MSATHRGSVAFLIGCLAASAPLTPAQADEGGLSFWVPGFFGSLAAAPQQPGFSFATIYYHPDVKAGADVAFARQVTRGNITVPFQANLNVNLQGRADLAMAIPSYTFSEKVLGAQAVVALLVPYGRSQADVNATLQGLGPLGLTLSGSASDSVIGFGDLAPMFSLRWNEGVHNYMTYITGDIPVGRYSATSLANLGIGHSALDAGGSYTYFNPQTGNEFSATLGFTYNFENTHTDYQNGIDMHLDVGTSKFVTKQWQIGAVGYLYQQLSCDSGSGDRVGCFESRVIGIGPQIGYIFEVSKETQGYFNVKAYKEFAADHRADDWNVWVTLAFSPAAKETPPSSTRPRFTK
jgi:hypothetical protein